VLIPAILFLIALFALGIIFGRMLIRRDVERKRRELAGASGPAAKKRRMTRREKILASLEPDPEIPTVIDLMHEEARDTGVNEIPGGEQLEVPVKLKVWHRDGGPHFECPRSSMRFEIAEGVDPEQATVEDVRLVCREAHPASPPAEQAPPADAGPEPPAAEPD
jgi:hypothetical protein